MGGGSDFLHGCEVRVLQDGRRLGWLTRLLFDGEGQRIGVLWIEEMKPGTGVLAVSAKPLFIGCPIRSDDGEWLGVIRDLERVPGMADLGARIDGNGLSDFEPPLLFQELIWCQSHWLLRMTPDSRTRLTRMLPRPGVGLAVARIDDCLMHFAARVSVETDDGAQLVAQGEPITDTVICLAVRTGMLERLDAKIGH
jgi:hypothetical protein